MTIQDIKETLLATNADLTSARFSNVKLTRAQFADVDLAQAQFTDANFSGATFHDVNFAHVELADCDVTGMRIRGVLVSELLKLHDERS